MPELQWQVAPSGTAAGSIPQTSPAVEALWCAEADELSKRHREQLLMLERYHEWQLAETLMRQQRALEINCPLLETPECIPLCGAADTDHSPGGVPLCSCLAGTSSHSHDYLRGASVSALTGDSMQVHTDPVGAKEDYPHQGLQTGSDDSLKRDHLHPLSSNTSMCLKGSARDSGRSAGREECRTAESAQENRVSARAGVARRLDEDSLQGGSADRCARSVRVRCADWVASLEPPARLDTPEPAAPRWGFFARLWGSRSPRDEGSSGIV